MNVINIKELIKKYNESSKIISKRLSILYITDHSRLRDILIKDIVNNENCVYCHKSKVITIIDNDQTTEVEFNIINDFRIIAGTYDIIIYHYHKFNFNVVEEIIVRKKSGTYVLTIPINNYNDFLEYRDRDSLVELRCNIESEFDKLELGLRE